MLFYSNSGYVNTSVCYINIHTACPVVMNIIPLEVTSKVNFPWYHNNMTAMQTWGGTTLAPLT